MFKVEENRSGNGNSGDLVAIRKKTRSPGMCTVDARLWARWRRVKEGKQLLRDTR